MKLSTLVIDSNLNDLFNSTESAARGSITNILIKPNENILKLHSYLTTQYIMQFAIQRYVKPKNLIHQNHYLKIRRLLSELSIVKIYQVNHEARHYAVTASQLLTRQKFEGIYSHVWMIDQLALISNLPESEIMKLLPQISNFLQIEIGKCESTIRKTKYADASHQESLFGEDVTDAQIDSTPSRKRNVVIK